jgi:hypothetical protein
MAAMMVQLVKEDDGMPQSATGGSGRLVRYAVPEGLNP